MNGGAIYMVHTNKINLNMNKFKDNFIENYQQNKLAAGGTIFVENSEYFVSN